jgi:hypothetical protein
MAANILDHYGLLVIIGANLKSDAQKPERGKSMASVVQMLRPKGRQG